jgi:mannose/cellobiose epimerase-like protein (N-acyl-D-glucosamine 2-epimerase family)
MAAELSARVPELKSLYLNCLFDDVVPFWVKNSPDKEYGGYFTCLDTKGTTSSSLQSSPSVHASSLRTKI